MGSILISSLRADVDKYSPVLGTFSKFCYEPLTVWKENNRVSLVLLFLGFIDFHVLCLYFRVYSIDCFLLS